MIQGVQIKKLKVIKDNRGFLMEMLRSDDKIFQKFGQVYMTFCKYGVAKAWHYHKLQDDYFICLEGRVLVVLYDQRKKSPPKADQPRADKTFGEINKFILLAPDKKCGQISRSCKIATSDKGVFLLKIPKGVVHGFTALTKNGSKVLNVPTKVYNHKKPDEYRMPWDTKEIKFKWPSFIRRGG